MKIILIFFVALLSTRATASFSPQLPYYTQALFQEVHNPQQNSQKIKRILFEVLSKAHTRQIGQEFDELLDECTSENCYRQKTIDYRIARKILFGRIHLLQSENGYAMKDVYCETVLTADQFRPGQAPGPNKIPDPSVINTEHSWPQSKFSSAFPKELQKGDLHILYPVSPRANSSRSNHPFANVSAVRSQPCAASKLGYTGSGGRQLFFEPPSSHKGNVARAVLYFSIRYKMPLDLDQETTLKEWMGLDPVDEDEIHRNEEIFKAQGNRNPFIDYPELARLIQDF